MAPVLLEIVSAMKFFAIMGLGGHSIAHLEKVEIQILNFVVHLRLVPSAPF